MKLEKDEAYIRYCLSLKNKRLQIEEEQALYLFRYHNSEKKDFPQNVEDINTHFRQLSRLYHPDQNRDDQERCTRVSQCINAARTVLLGAKNKSGNTNSCYFASACNSDSDLNWSNEVSTILTSLARRGIAELKESSPDVFDETFLTKKKLIIPASTLVMKGIVHVINAKDRRYLGDSLKSIDKFLPNQNSRPKISIDIGELAPDLASFISDTGVSWFDIFPMAQLAAQSMWEGAPTFMPGILDAKVNFNSLSDDTKWGVCCLKTLDEEQRKIDETKMSKLMILHTLLPRFKKRAIDRKSKKFKTKRDQHKYDLFWQALEKKILTLREVKEIADTHTGRHTFGLFRLRPPTSKKEFDDLLAKYNLTRFLK